MNHFILTRFNVRVAYADPETRLDPAWLHHRFELFDRFCYPSVRNQSNHNFRWLVLFDSDTPHVFKEKIAKYARWNIFIPVYMDASNGERRRITQQEIMNHMSCGVQRVVTTRLDNDDALHSRFVQTLQDITSSMNEDEVAFINFTRGYIWHDSKLYLTEQESNPFISMVEKAHDFQTVYCGVEHARLFTVAPIREVLIAPLWLQVIHEKNVSNRVQGLRRPITALRGFKIDNATPTQNDWLSCWIERGRDTLKRNIRRLVR